MDDQIKLEIIDFGRGIDAKDLPRIFDKGFTSTRNHRDNAATGMGLYLAKKVSKSTTDPYRCKVKTWKRNHVYVHFSSKQNDFVQITGM